jgi:RNA polymerase sigma-70 factor (ECF subfamily)
VTDLSRLTDDELLAATPKDPEAYGVFYERHATAILGFLSRSSGDTELALDLTAEVFATALKSVERYRPGEAPARAWLFGIAKNKLLASRRRTALDLSARRKLRIPELQYAESALEEVEALLAAEEDDYLKGLDQLPPDERDAVRARVIDEREYADIAASTGLSQAAIRQRVSRGLAKLGRIVGGRG